MAQEPIAIIGAGCRFPGGANKPSELWRVLSEAKDLAQNIPIDRFNVDRFYAEDGNHHGTANVTKSYLLEEDIRRFDAGFFAIPPAEASAMDPQHRLLMETVFEALEAGGQSISALQGSNTAAYVGIMCTDWNNMTAKDWNSVATYAATGCAASNASSRLSYFFDWHGPAMTIDTACSSSLVAVHQAVQALRAGTSRLAIAAGSNVIMSPMPYIAESKLHMLSPTGYSQMWDQGADGYARGEGVAALLLKKLSDAIADGDHIECIIRETGVNQDGRTKGLTMPSAQSQAALIRDTYARAGLDPLNQRDRCQYFEAHGTGTPAGDPKEAEAIHDVFFPDPAAHAKEVLHVGSIKTTIGHTEGTAGIAGIMKAYLSIQHGLIAPNLHFKKLTSTIEPFYNNLNLVATAQPWPALQSGEPRRASVNSFGFGGTNAHAIIESCGDISHKAVPGHQAKAPSVPFLFSAASEKSLRAVLSSYQTYLLSSPNLDTDGLAYTLANKRSTLQFKTSMVAQTQEELIKKIEIALSKSGPAFTSRPVVSDPAILGIFTGQGAQWAQMGLKLIRSSTVARNVINIMDAALATLPEDDSPKWTIMQEIETEKEHSRTGEAAVAQPLTCAVQLMLVELLHKAGVKFRAVVGHSSGEITAAYAAGMISLTDAIRIAYYRGFHAHRAQGVSGQKGLMCSASTTFEDAQELCNIDDIKGRVVVACSNAPESVTLSGDADAIEECINILEEEEKTAKVIKVVDRAYHSHHVLPASEPFLQSLQHCNITIKQPGPDAPKWFSSVRLETEMEAGPELTGQYWTDNLNSPVLFYPAVKHAIEVCTSFDAAIEVGPHPQLQVPVTDIFKKEAGTAPAYCGALGRFKNDVDFFQVALANLWQAAGAAAVDFEQFHGVLYPSDTAPKVLHDLPNYPWSHDRALWTESRVTKLEREHEGKFHELLGSREADGAKEEWRWRNSLIPKEIPWLLEHGLQGQVAFPATGFVCLAMEAGMQIANKQPVSLLELTNFSIVKAMIIDEIAGVETLVSVTKIQREPGEITAAFACFSSESKDNPHLALNATGNIRVELGGNRGDAVLPPASLASHGMVPVNVDHFYEEVAKLGYDYGTNFRGLSSLERKLNLCHGTIINPLASPQGEGLMFHPGMLDVTLQGFLAAYSSPGDGRLWTTFAPSSFTRISLVPELCGRQMTKEVSFDCLVTKVESSKLVADIEVCHTLDAEGLRGHQAIYLEGVTFVPLAAASKADDKVLFAHTIWGPEEPDGTVTDHDRASTQGDIEKALDMERVSVHYLRKLLQTKSAQDRATSSLPRHLEALLDYAAHVVGMVDADQELYVSSETSEDTQTVIQSIVSKYDVDDPDFSIIKAAGENLPAVIESPDDKMILEYLRQDSMLDNLYKNGLGFSQANVWIAQVMGQIAHRYPNMSICEIGAGVGGASRAIMAELSTAFASYTYTDISAGFFGQAQKDFAAYKDRMVFKTLDCSRDPVDQGFIEGSYDLIVASNVLHATSDLDETLKNARKLLRPGGYLVLLEIIQPIIRIGLVMGGLPGWWVGCDTGRPWSPCINAQQWSDLMQRTGFSALENPASITSTVAIPMTILVSRAMDTEVATLMRPLAASAPVVTSAKPEMILLGGNSPVIHRVIEQLVSVLAPHYMSIIRARTWRDLDPAKISEHCSVLNLSDFDSSFWKDITNEEFETFKELFLAAQTAIWVTWGSDRDNSDAAITRGFFRSLKLELAQTQIQFVDFEQPDELDVGLVAESMVRLEKTSNFYNDEPSETSNMLWTVEPEIRVRSGKVLLPRLKPQREMNDRYNSQKRAITNSTDLRNSIVNLVWDDTDSRYYLRPAESTLPRLEGHRRVRAVSSLLASCSTNVGRLFIVMGTDIDSHEQILTATTEQASQFTVPEAGAIAIRVQQENILAYLSSISGFLVCEKLSTRVPEGTTVVLHEAGQLSSMLEAWARNHKCSLTFLSYDPPTSSGPSHIRTHPLASDRQMKSSLPRNARFYCDLSFTRGQGLGSEQDHIVTGARLAGLLPEICKKYDHSLFLARESRGTLERNGETIEKIIQKILQDADAFATAATHVVQLPEITLLEAGSSEKDINMMTVLHWQRDAEVPCKVEPIYTRKDLFTGDKTYWLVGLAGDVGRTLCDFMVEHGARHVVLSSRNPQVEEQWVEAHRREGVEAVYLKADITSKADLIRAHEDIKKTMPPVGGVASGALILKDSGFINQTLENFHTVSRVKIEGTTYLDEIFPDNTLDWFIAFSSLSAALGNMGQMSYSAANEFMKALVVQRRARGCAGSSLDICQVFGVGYMERERRFHTPAMREQTAKVLSRTGGMVVCETDLHQLFAEAVLAGRAGSATDPEIVTGIKVLTSEEADETLWGRGNPRRSHFVQDLGAATAPSIGAKGGVVPMKQLLKLAKNGEAQARILIDAFIAKLRVSLMMGEEPITDSTLLPELGVDSLVAVEIRTWFAQETGVEIAMLNILRGGSIEDLVGLVLERRAKAIAAAEVAAATAAPPASAKA